MIVGSVMTDHPSWLSTSEGVSYRAIRCQGSLWALNCEPAVGRCVTTSVHLVGHSEAAPVLDVCDPATVVGPATMAGRLRAAGTVARWRNPDMWDALATSIVRQVIRAAHARKLYRSFCQAHGEPVNTPNGPAWLFPTPEVVLDIPDMEFTRLGMAFKNRPLRAAAEAYLELGAKWAQLDPSDLVTRVQTVPRIGPWTAGATVADLTNDYSLYPYADLAVRTWAKHLAPERTWPEAEPEFGLTWQRLTGEQLSIWTLLTLAWGVRHANVTGATAL